MRKVSMATRAALVEAVGARYRNFTLVRIRRWME
jgi:hypothetical protein